MNQESTPLSLGQKILGSKVFISLFALILIMGALGMWGEGRKSPVTKLFLPLEYYYIVIDLILIIYLLAFPFLQLTKNRKKSDIA